MHPDLERALLRQKTRKNFKNILHEKKINEENLYKAFVEPFTDVVQAAKIGIADIASNLMLIAGSVLTLSPKKQKERLDKYNERKKKLEARWEPLMKRTDDALSSGDADLVALAFAPGLYFTSALGAKTYNAAEGVGSYLEDLGMKKGILALLPGVSSDAVTDDKPDKDKEEGSLLNKLTALFAGVSVAAAAAEGVASGKKKNESTYKGEVLSEATGGDFSKDFQEFSENTGLDVQFEKMQDDLIEYYKGLQKDYEDLVSNRMEFAKVVKDSEDPESFIKSIDAIDGDDDLMKNLEAIKKEIADATNKLEKDPDFIQKIKEEDPAKMSAQEVSDAAANVVFADLKTTLEKDLDTKIEKFRQSLGEEISKSIPDEKTIKMLKTTKKGVELSNLIQGLKNDYIIK